MTLDEFSQDIPGDPAPKQESYNLDAAFKMWPLYPFIARDIAVWVPEEVKAEEVARLIRDTAGGMVVRGPELFDEFKKEGRVSYAFRLVFQSYDRTLTDEEVNGYMVDVAAKLAEHSGWQVR